MTILEMLQLRCDFQKNPVSEKLPEQADMEQQTLPEDLTELYREADGGRGTITPKPWREAPDFILYSRKQMRETKQWFFEYSAGHYEALFLENKRRIHGEETEQLSRAGQELTFLGECGDPEWPDYLCRYQDAYLLIDQGSLDFPFRKHWSPEEEACFTKGSFMEFLSSVLWHLETLEL